MRKHRVFIAARSSDSRPQRLQQYDPTPQSDDHDTSLDRSGHGKLLYHHDHVFGHKSISLSFYNETVGGETVAL